MPNPGNPQSWNKYSYTLNNPIRYSDPTGHRVDEGCGSGEQCVLPQPNDDQPQTDVTEWLFNEFSPQVEYLLENYDCSDIGVFNGARCVGYKYGSHYNLFGNGGRYDIKLKMEYLSDPYGAVILCGANNACRWVNYQTPGNILFGYLSAAREIPQIISWPVGGAREQLDYLENNQPLRLDYWPYWFDNPEDKAAVDFGYELYDEFGADITWEEFQSRLTPQVLQSFETPEDWPLSMPTSQSNNYPPGYFYNP